MIPSTTCHFHAILCAILIASGMHHSGILHNADAIMYSGIFAKRYRYFTTLYTFIQAPPWCFRMLQMCGMVGFLNAKLLRHPRLHNQALHPKLRAQLLRKLFRRGFNLEPYVNYIRDPSRMQIFRDIHIGGILQRPYDMTFYHGCFFVTAGELIYKIDTSNPRLSLIQFTRIQNSTLYGLDVADDGTLAMVGYSNMRLYLFSQQAEEILDVRIGSPQHHQLLSSGVCWTHDFRAVICFTSKGLIAMKRTGEFICQLGTKGSQPGSFRGEGQIQRLPEPGHFLVTDSDNNRVQIVKISLETQLITVIRVFGYGEMFRPLGSANFGNCILTSGHGDNCLYFTDSSGRTRQFFDGVLGSPRFVMSLPGGIFVVADTGNGRISFMSENLCRSVSRETCLPGIPLDDTFFRIPIQMGNGGAAAMPKKVAVSAQRVDAATQCEPFVFQTVAVSAQVEPDISSVNALLTRRHYCNMM